MDLKRKPMYTLKKESLEEAWGNSPDMVEEEREILSMYWTISSLELTCLIKFSKI